MGAAVGFRKEVAARLDLRGVQNPATLVDARDAGLGRLAVEAVAEGHGVKVVVGLLAVTMLDGQGVAILVRRLGSADLGHLDTETDMPEEVELFAVAVQILDIPLWAYKARIIWSKAIV